MYKDTNENEATSIDETGADMFLNWVYRTNDGAIIFATDPNNNVPGTWNGFLNKSWTQNTEKNDTSFPGDARMSWMNTVMIEIFATKGW